MIYVTYVTSRRPRATATHLRAPCCTLCTTSATTSSALRHRMYTKMDSEPAAARLQTSPRHPWPAPDVALPPPTTAPVGFGSCRHQTPSRPHGISLCAASPDVSEVHLGSELAPRHSLATPSVLLMSHEEDFTLSNLSTSYSLHDSI